MKSIPYDGRERLVGRLAMFGAWAASIVIDSAFLLVWLATQWAVQRSARLLASSLDHLILSVFEATFALSTLCVVVLYDYMDIRTMIIQMQREIDLQKREVVSPDGKAPS